MLNRFIKIPQAALLGAFIVISTLSSVCAMQRNNEGTSGWTPQDPRYASHVYAAPNGWTPPPVYYPPAFNQPAMPVTSYLDVPVQPQPSLDIDVLPAGVTVVSREEGSASGRTSSGRRRLLPRRVEEPEEKRAPYFHVPKPQKIETDKRIMGKIHNLTNSLLPELLQIARDHGHTVSADPNKPSFLRLGESNPNYYRAIFNIFYHLDAEHTHAIPGTGKIASGADFSRNWRYAETKQRLSDTFNQLSDALRDRVLEIWSYAEQDLVNYRDGELEGEPDGALDPDHHVRVLRRKDRPDVVEIPASEDSEPHKPKNDAPDFPFNGQEDTDFYSAALHAFHAVSRKYSGAAHVYQIAAQIVPKVLPLTSTLDSHVDAPRQVNAINHALERLYRFGLTFKERKSYNKAFQKYLRDVVGS